MNYNRFCTEKYILKNMNMIVCCCGKINKRKITIKKQKKKKKIEKEGSV